MGTVDDRIPVGLYWDPQLRQDARAAFVSDLRHDPDAPTAWIGWLHRALHAHASLSAGERAGLGIPAPAPRGRGQGQGVSRMSPLEPATLQLVDDAVAADLAEVGTLGSRSGFTHQAVTVAVAAARSRAPGGVLPTAPARLSYNPHRRRPLRRRLGKAG